MFIPSGKVTILVFFPKIDILGVLLLDSSLEFYSSSKISLQQHFLWSKTYKYRV